MTSSRKTGDGRVSTEQRVYTLRSLVPEITGICLPGKQQGSSAEEVKAERREFNAAYQQLKEIRSAMLAFTGVEESPGVSEAERASFVALARGMLPGGSVHAEYLKLRRKEPLTVEECDRVIRVIFQAQAEAASGSDEERRQMQEQLEAELGVGSWSEVLRLRSRVARDLKMVSRIRDIETRRLLLDEYHKVLGAGLAEWRTALQTTFEIEKKLLHRAP